jgi:hypothetical protein
MGRLARQQQLLMKLKIAPSWAALLLSCQVQQGTFNSTLLKGVTSFALSQI